MSYGPRSCNIGCVASRDVTFTQKRERERARARTRNERERDFYVYLLLVLHRVSSSYVGHLYVNNVLI
jgi:hypothetical protein